MPHNRGVRARALLGAALVGVLAVTGYGLYHLVGSITAPAPPAPGCQAGTGAQAVTLDPEQAGIAATIAGVAARHRLPRQAVTVAYAAALQESKLHNLDYGDLDSVGIFQQRPSQGWGTARQLQNPVYATTRFFAALVRVPGYTKMPVDQAAQDVQHSADGTAYQQYEDIAAQLAGYFTGAAPHAVSCWFPPQGKADLAGATRQLVQTFGPEGSKGVVVRITTGVSAQDKDRRVAVVHAQRDAGWTVAGWMVAHSEQYRITQIRYAGYDWKAADGTTGWQREPGAKVPPRGSIVAG